MRHHTHFTFIVAAVLATATSDLLHCTTWKTEGERSTRYSNQVDMEPYISKWQDNNTCSNGGKTLFPHGCLCPEGFFGERCHIGSSRCSPNPCENGECRITTDGYRCSCEEGYYGKLCEKKKSWKNRAKRDTLPLTCDTSLNGDLESCFCQHSRNSIETIVCHLQRGETCVVPADLQNINDTFVIDVYQISRDIRVVAQIGAIEQCRPHFDITAERHPRPVFVDVDESVEGIFTITSDVGTSHIRTIESELIVIVENKPRPQPIEQLGVFTKPFVMTSLGSNATLPCEYERDVYIVYWLKEGDPTSGDFLVSLDLHNDPGKRSGPGYEEGKYYIEDDYSLLVKNVTQADEGTYVCQVSDFALGAFKRNTTKFAIQDFVTNLPAPSHTEYDIKSPTQVQSTTEYPNVQASHRTVNIPLAAFIIMIIAYFILGLAIILIIIYNSKCRGSSRTDGCGNTRCVESTEMSPPASNGDLNHRAADHTEIAVTSALIDS